MRQTRVISRARRAPARLGHLPVPDGHLEGPLRDVRRRGEPLQRAAARAAVTAYARMRDGDPAANWRGRDEAGAPSRYPRRVFTAACRAASRVGDVSASRVAVTAAIDGVAGHLRRRVSRSDPRSNGSRRDAHAAEAIFLRARERDGDSRTPNPESRGRAPSARRVACRLIARRICWRRWARSRSCASGRRVPSRGERNKAKAKAGEGGASSTSTSTSTSNASSSVRVARRAAAERRAAAPAYAQVMHAPCDAGRHAEALASTSLCGRRPPDYPTRRHRALFKATAGAGKGGGPSPRKAAARTVADAVLAAVAVSRGEAPFLPYEEEDEEEDDADDERDDDRDGERDGRLKAHASTERPRVGGRLRAMATATALGDATLSATAIRATLQVAAAGGFRRRVRGARACVGLLPRRPRTELTPRRTRAGDARGAVAHWNANRRALTAESEGRRRGVDGGEGRTALAPGANPRRARDRGDQGALRRGRGDASRRTSAGGD